MRSVVLALMLLSSMNAFAEKATAQSQLFPYDAVLLDDEVYSRSGPGRQYYPTGRFRKGDRVTVVRHDPGGWFMIDPPLGSFNWVRKEYIRREGDHGVVVADAAVVAWMGTTFGDDHYVEKRRLQTGERVEILAEKILKDERGEVPYYKIQPPSGDFRWVPGAKVIPADKASGMSQNRGRNKMRDPNVSPVDLSEFGDEGNSPVKSSLSDKRVPPPRDLAGETRSAPNDLDRDPKPSPFARSREADSKLPFETGDDSPAASANISANKNGSPAWDRIRAVDDELQVMLKKDSREWDFTPIETELRELVDQDETSGAARNRLAMLGRYQRIKSDQDELAKIMDETSRRDTDLAKAAAKPAQPFTPPTVVSEPSATNRPAAPRGAAPMPNATNRPLAQPSRNPTATQNIRPQPLPGMQPTQQGFRPAQPGTPPNNAIPASSSPLKPRFDGAGIIQRSTSSALGVPKHVLMHPSGRVLAYLESEPGVNLDNFVGEQMGLEGRRAFRPELNADLLTVHGLKPVKLKP